jgi:nucleotide-binding universal stress UspA family protein
VNAGRAFMHALAISLKERASLTMLHAGASRKSSGNRSFPSVRAVLRSWNLLPDHHKIDDAFQALGLKVKKINLHDSNPLHSIPEYVRSHDTDLMVIATRGDERSRLGHRRSVAEPISRLSERATLFIPAHVQGFVSPLNGQLSVRRILVPVDDHPGSGKAIETAILFISSYCDAPAEIVRLFVGRESEAPQSDVPEEFSGGYIKIKGNVAETIVETANRIKADLIVIGSDHSTGKRGISFGNITGKTIHRSPCPTLTVLP